MRVLALIGLYSCLPYYVFCLWMNDREMVEMIENPRNIHSMRASRIMQARRSEKRLVEISAHGDGLSHGQAIVVNTTKPKKQKYFFKVHTHDEDVALMETGLGNNTITEDGDWRRTDIDGDFIEAGFEEVQSGKCFNWPAIEEADGVKKQEAYDKLMIEAQRVQEMALDLTKGKKEKGNAFHVGCDRFDTKGGFLTHFSWDTRGYATKILLKYSCCTYIAEGTAREDTITSQSEVKENPDGSILNVMGLGCGNGEKALRGWQFVTEAGSNGNKIYVECQEEALPGPDSKDSPVTWKKDAVNEELPGQGKGWRKYAGKMVRARELKSQNIQCSFGKLLTSWVFEDGTDADNEPAWRIKYTCKPIGNQIVMLGDGRLCQWVGDPHFKTFDMVPEVSPTDGKHDPVVPTAGFYWIVKSSVVAVQAYYQGVRHQKDPMRTRLVAFGGKFMLGNTLIVGKDIKKAFNANEALVFTFGKINIKWNLWWNKKEVNTPFGAKVKADAEGGFELCTTDEVLKTSADCDLAHVSKNGHKVSVTLPLKVTFTQEERTDWCDQRLHMRKMPDWEPAQCGEYARYADTTVPTKDNRNTASCCGITDVNENMFLSDFSGDPGEAKRKEVLKLCEPTEKYPRAQEQCRARFGEVGSHNPTLRMFYLDCLMDLCDSEDTPGGEMVNGDAEEGIDRIMGEDFDTPRKYAISTVEMPPSVIVEAKCSTDADCDFAGCGTPENKRRWTVYCGKKEDDDAEAKIKAEGVCMLVQKVHMACEGRECGYRGRADIFNNYPGAYCCKDDFMRPCNPGIAPQDGCEAGTSAATVRSEGENRHILELAGESALVQGKKHLALAAYSKGGKWYWRDGDEVRKTCDGCLENYNFVPGKHEPKKDGLTLCWSLDPANLGKWEACTENVPVYVACVETKMYGKMRGVDAKTARMACGENKQMAMPKTASEWEFLTKLLWPNWEPTQSMWLGAHFARDVKNKETGRWIWEDGYPMEPSIQLSKPDLWEGGQPFPVPTLMRGGSQDYLCMTPAGKITNQCFGADGKSPEYDVLCEIRGADKDCARSDQNMEFGSMQMNPSPWYRGTYRDHCYYVGRPNTGVDNGANCDSFCEKMMPEISGEKGAVCDKMGMRKIASSIKACEAVAAILGVKLTREGSIRQAKRQSANYGCTVGFNPKNQEAAVEVVTPYLGDYSDICSNIAVTRTHHRICACAPISDYEDVDPAFVLKTGTTVLTVVQNPPKHTEDGLLETRSYTGVSNTGVSVMKVMAHGGVPNSDIAYRLEINWDDKIVTRDCKVGGVVKTSMQTGSFPFYELSRGDTYTIDLHVDRGEEGDQEPMFVVKANGVHQPALDMPQVCGAAQGEIQYENMPARESKMVEQIKLSPSQTTNYDVDRGPNPCETDPFAFHQETITWYFHLKPKADSLGGKRCIRCEYTEWALGSNIYIEDKKITVTIKGSQPYRQVFDGYTVPDDGETETEIAISYVARERVLELYVNGERHKILYYTIADDYRAQGGQVGCYDTSGHIWQGEISLYHVESEEYKDRPIYATCDTYPCASFNDVEQRLYYKNKDNSANINCLLANETGDGARPQPVCQDRHRGICCDILPMCDNAETPLVCETQSTYRHDANITPCDDALCEETEKEKCCVTYQNCESYICPPQKMHRDNVTNRWCNDVNCSLPEDEDICCEPVERCRDYSCSSSDKLWRPAAMNLVCSDKKCTAQDEDQCCAPKGNCLAMKCPANHLLKANAHERKCADENCTDTNWEICCAPKNHCLAGLTCPSNKVHVANAEHVPCANTNCSLSDDEAHCCVSRASCTTAVCDHGYEQDWDAANKTCEGRVCISQADHDHCCAKKHHCDQFDEANCESDMILKAFPETIMCDHLDCENTARTTCCTFMDRCDSYPCLPTYIHLPNAADQPCGDQEENRTECNDDDLLLCCERAASCQTHTCDLDHVKIADAENVYCQGKECTALDEATCCSKKGVCSAYNCSDGFGLRHNAHQIMCKTETCDGTDSTHCCAPKNNCSTLPCKDGYRHKDNYHELLCAGYECTEHDNLQCCTRTQTCAEWDPGCPAGYEEKQDASYLFCEKQFCSHADVHRCCDSIGTCTNFTCSNNRVHIPDAKDTLCNDRECSPEETPEEQCCTEPNRCISYDCPLGYVHKNNASEEFCEGIVCNDFDLQACCDEVSMCTDLGAHNCPAGYTLNANHQDIMCATKKCTEADQEICCVPRGHCFSKACTEGMLHRHDEDLLCTDENCTGTESDVCCAAKNTCAVYKCPQYYQHVDAATEITCSGFMCGPSDQSKCCDLVPSCAAYECPPGTERVHNAATQYCKEEECTDEDRLTCCTGVGRCNSYECPDGYQHRHNAEELYCEDANCTVQSYKECCVVEGLCLTYECPPETHVHRSDANSQYCATWFCTAENNDTDNCCTERAPCKDEICPEHWVLTWEADKVLCEDMHCKEAAPDNETCCTEVGKCDHKPCPPRYLHVHNAADIFCSNKSCDSTDYNTCCGPEDSCHTYACPDEYVHKWDADQRECQGFVCDATDLDTCCDHRAFCNYYECDFGYALKNESHILLCENFTCSEEDLHTCCDHVGDCSMHACEGEQWTHKLNASSIQCEDKYCLKTNQETCCMPATSCAENFVCSQHGDFTEAPPVAGQTLYCSDTNCSNGLSECCLPLATCNEYELKAGFEKRHGAGELTCASWHCNDHDVHTCAAEPGFCSSYKCPHLWQLKSKAHIIPCDDLDCNATSKEKCCAPDGACLTYDCSAGLVHRENVSEYNCSNTTCTTTDDTNCCEAQATCLSFCCNPRLNDTSCPIPGTDHPDLLFSKRDNAAAIHCEGLSCTQDDHHECCKEDGKCSSFTCEFGKVPRHNSHNVSCTDANCTVSEANELACCVEEDDCPSMECPKHMIHKLNSEITKCESASGKCSYEDIFTCCDARHRCDSFACVGLYEDHPDKGESWCFGLACEAHDWENCCQLKENATEESPSPSPSPDVQNDEAPGGKSRDPGTSKTKEGELKRKTTDDGDSHTVDESGSESFAQYSCFLSLPVLLSATFLAVAGVSTS